MMDTIFFVRLHSKHHYGSFDLIRILTVVLGPEPFCLIEECLQGAILIQSEDLAKMWQPRFLIWALLLVYILMATILALWLCANLKKICHREMSNSCSFQPFNSRNFWILIFHLTSAITWKAENNLINLWLGQKSSETKHVSRKNI